MRRLLLTAPGLDEIRGWEHFTHLCDAINRFAEDHGDNPIIISSRPFALRDRRFGKAEEMEIAPFNRDQIALFLNHYFGEDEDGKLLPRLMSPDLRDLVSMPTLIGAIVRRIHQGRQGGQSGKVETDRLKLYEGIVADLAARIDTQKNVERFKLDDHDGRLKLAFLTQLAFDRLFDDDIEHGKDAERVAFTTDFIEASARRFCRDTREAFALAADVKATPLVREVAENVWAFSHLTLHEYLAAKALAAHPNCENIFIRACFHPLLVEMETLPMALSMVRNPERLYETLEQLPESLDHKLLRLRARGLALARINPKTLQGLLQRLDDFITSKKPEEAYYFATIVRAFAQTRGETLDAVALSIAARLDSDDNPSVRRSAAYALGNIGSEHAVDALLKALLKDQDSSVRQRAALALGSTGSERACDTLLKVLLEDQDSSVQVSAAYALGRFGPERMNVVLCEALLEDQDSSVLWRMIDVLGIIGSESEVDTLRKALLEDRKSSVRGSTVGALRKALLKDQKPSIRGNAANSQGSIGAEHAVDPLLKVLLEDQGAYAAWHPADVLGNIAAEKFAAGLMLALSSENKSVRRKAAEVVGYYVNEPCLAELERLVASDESDEVKEAARAAVEKLKRKLRYFDSDAAP